VLVILAIGDFSGARRLVARRRIASDEVAADSPVLAMRNIRYRYTDADEDAVSDFSMEIRPAELVVLEGDNGTGKSTIQKIAAGLCDPAEGQILLDGKDVTSDAAARVRSIVYVNQNPHESVVDTLTVDGNLLLAHNGDHPSIWRRALTSRKAEAVEEFLDIGGFPPTHRNREAGTLSGGQRQIVNLMSLLARQTLPRVVMLDEPTNNLDEEHTARCHQIIDALRSRGTAVVLVSHTGLGNLQAQRIIQMPRRTIASDLYRAAPAGSNSPRETPA
jgi:ABC-type sugar transport system ATPase subunit